MNDVTIIIFNNLVHYTTHREGWSQRQPNSPFYAPCTTEVAPKQLYQRTILVKARAWIEKNITCQLGFSTMKSIEQNIQVNAHTLRLWRRCWPANSQKYDPMQSYKSIFGLFTVRNSPEILVKNKENNITCKYKRIIVLAISNIRNILSEYFERHWLGKFNTDRTDFALFIGENLQFLNSQTKASTSRASGWGYNTEPHPVLDYLFEVSC